MAHLQRIAFAVLCFIVGLSPTVISFVLFICTGYADSKQRSRWVSTRQISSPRWPTSKKSVNCNKNKQLALFFFVFFGISEPCRMSRTDLTKEFKIKQSSPLRREVDSLIRSYQERCAKLITDSQINNVCPLFTF